MLGGGGTGHGGRGRGSGAGSGDDTGPVNGVGLKGLGLLIFILLDQESGRVEFASDVLRSTPCVYY